MTKNIAIVGAGPAGLFAAHKLAGKANITIFEKGKDIESRKCFVPDRKFCTGCKPCNIVSGVGGAGLFSDGKLIFDNYIGNNLSELISEERNSALIQEVENFFMDYEVKIIDKDEDKVRQIKKVARQNGIDFVYGRQSHIGSTNLISVIERMRNNLKSNGIEFVCNKNISSLSELDYDTVILAPGRSGSRWLEKILVENNLPYSFRPVDIGVRIEVPEEITEDVTNFTRDMKFYIRTEKYGDRVRTFCTCPQGIVTKEMYENFVLVNGHSDSHKKTHNTNFALIVTIPLTKPLVNTNLYAHDIAQVFDNLGDKKPTLQRFGDLKQHRRSKEENDSRYTLSPTLRDVTFGDISLAMPGRYLYDLVESIERLDRIMPGLANDSTILYAPEMKFHGLRIKTDDYLRATEKLYVAGDGAGLSRGIVGAAASGLLAAEGILQNL